MIVTNLFAFTFQIWTSISFFQFYVQYQLLLSVFQFFLQFFVWSELYLKPSSMRKRVQE